MLVLHGPIWLNKVFGAKNISSSSLDWRRIFISSFSFFLFRYFHFFLDFHIYSLVLTIFSLSTSPVKKASVLFFQSNLAHNPLPALQCIHMLDIPDLFLTPNLSVYSVCSLLRSRPIFVFCSIVPLKPLDPPKRRWYCHYASRIGKTRRQYFFDSPWNDYCLRVSDPFVWGERITEVIVSGKGEERCVYSFLQP